MNFMLARKKFKLSKIITIIEGTNKRNYIMKQNVLISKEMLNLTLEGRFSDINRTIFFVEEEIPEDWFQCIEKYTFKNLTTERDKELKTLGFPYLTAFSYSFKNQDDAILFKLTWCD